MNDVFATKFVSNTYRRQFSSTGLERVSRLTDIPTLDHFPRGDKTALPERFGQGAILVFNHLRALQTKLAVKWCTNQLHTHGHMIYEPGGNSRRRLSQAIDRAQKPLSVEKPIELIGHRMGWQQAVPYAGLARVQLDWLDSLTRKCGGDDGYENSGLRNVFQVHC